MMEKIEKIEEEIEEKPVHSESKKRPLEISGESDGESDGESESESDGESDAESKSESDGESDDDDEVNYESKYLIRSESVRPEEYNLEADSGEESPSDSEKEDDTEFEKEKESLSFEEREAKYLDEIESSDCFFVSDYPYEPGQAFGGIRRLPNCYYNDRTRHFCRLAVQLHNKTQPENEHLKFVKLVYCTIHLCSGLMFYLTFRAKKLSTGDIDEYQAKLWAGLVYDTLFIFRRKPPPQENKKDIAAAGCSSSVDCRLNSSEDVKECLSGPTKKDMLP